MTVLIRLMYLANKADLCLNQWCARNIVSLRLSVICFRIIIIYLRLRSSPVLFKLKQRSSTRKAIMFRSFRAIP